MWTLYDPAARPSTRPVKGKNVYPRKREQRPAPSTAEQLFFLLENVGSMDDSSTAVA